MDDDELDDILDGALEDFEKLEVKEKPKTSVTKTTTDEQMKPTAEVITEDEEKKLINDFASEMMKIFDQTGDSKEKKKPETQLNEEELQSKLEEALKNLGDASKNLNPNNENTDFEQDETFKKIMGMFSGEQNEEQMYGVLEKIMETLLSPEVLKEPMIQLKQKYPDWLKANKGTVTESEYNRIHEQYIYSCKIVDVYDTDEKNVHKLMELMKGMQELGQPPQEIIDQLSSEGGSVPQFPGGFGGSGGNDEQPPNCPTQ